VDLADGTPITAEFVRSLLDQAVAAYTESGGYDPALLAQARTVFEQVALADDFPTFLTLPAYELLP
jgi:malate synthase